MTIGKQASLATLLKEHRLKLPLVLRSAPHSFFLLISVQKYLGSNAYHSNPAREVSDYVLKHWPQGNSTGKRPNPGTTSDLQSAVQYTNELTEDATWSTTVYDQNFDALDMHQTSALPTTSFRPSQATQIWEDPGDAPTASGNIELHFCLYAGCQKVYSRKGDLSRHVKNAHEKPSCFMCHFHRCPRGIPGKGFARKDKLVGHLKSKKHGLSAKDAAYEATLHNA